MGVPEREKGDVYLKGKWLNIFQILGGKMDNQTNEAQMTPNRINPKKITRRHIIIKLSKVKDREF